MDASFYAPATATLPAMPRPAPPPRVIPDSAPPGFQVHPNTPRLRMEDLTTPGGDKMFGPDGLLIPPARSVAMVVNSALRVFSYRFDEAMRDNFVNARAMRRDAFIRGLMEERILPTVNRKWEIEIEDDKNQTQVLVRDQMAKIIRGTPALDAFNRALLDGVWFGRAGCQWNLYRNPDIDDFWTIRKWDPIHGDSIQWTFDGVPAVLMDSQTAGWYSGHGATWGPGGDLRPTDRGGTALVLQRPYWRSRFAVHQHMREKADYFEGELAGSVQGLGLRGLIYWHYVIRTEALTWMLSYMQAVGQMDLLVFNYPQGDDAAKLNAETMAKRTIGKAAIAAPYNPDKGNKPTVEQVPMNEAGLKALHELISDYFDRHIERIIVGQSMSSGADNDSGLGGTGRAEFAKACVPVAGSEILTRDGFKSPYDVQVGEDVLAYDVETDSCRWTPLLKKRFFENCPVDRLFLEQDRFEAFCTPDHSWAVVRVTYPDKRKKPRTDVVIGPRGKPQLAAQKKYLTQARHITRSERVVIAAPVVDTAESVLTPVEAAVLGWAITDGTIRVHQCRFSGVRYEISICQSKEKYLEAIRALMLEFTGTDAESVTDSVKYGSHAVGNGVVTATLPQRVWRVSREQSSQMLRQCGYRDRGDLPGIVTRLDGPARRSMLDAMMAGDGSIGQQQTFYNTDPHVLEAFEILCVLEGRATGKAKLKSKSAEHHRDYYNTAIKSNRYVYGNYLQREEAGLADVWCPTTKYGTWIMRQNGRVMITGNTKDEILMYDANRLDETRTTDLIGPLKKANFPWAKFPLRWKSIMPDAEAAEKVANGQTLISAGVTIKVDEFRGAAGYARPEEGDEVIGGPQTMGMGQVPGTTPNSPMHVAQPGGMPGSVQPPGNAPAQTYPRSTPPPEPQSGPQPPKPPQAPTAIGMQQPVRNDMGGMGSGAGTAPGPGGGPGTVPHMGYPGGGNTYIPKFGNRRRGIGFTRFDRYYAGLRYGLNDRFDAELHPRDDAGRFVAKHEIDAAASHPGKRAELRKTITKPEEQAKFDKLVDAAVPSHKATADVRQELHSEHGRLHTAELASGLAPVLKNAARTGDEAAALVETKRWLRHAREKVRAHYAHAKDKAAAQFMADYGTVPDNIEVPFIDAANTVMRAYKKWAKETLKHARGEAWATRTGRPGAGSVDRDTVEGFFDGAAATDKAYEAAREEIWDLIEPMRDAMGGKEKGYKLGRYYYGRENPPTLYAKFGCLLAPLYGEAGMAVRRAGAGIDDGDLAEKGREDEPHITIRYGFPSHITAADVGNVIGRPGPVKLRLGKIGFFAGDEFDVVYVAVESADLYVLHAQLGALPHTDTHEHYSPHATIAYVKPGLGKIYAERIPAADLDWIVAELDYKTPDAEPSPTSIPTPDPVPFRPSVKA